MRTKKSNIFNDSLFYFNEQNEPEAELVEPEEQKEEEAPIEAELDPEEQLSNVDKVYRLKKLYAKLLAISRIMDYYSDKSFDDLQKKVLESIDIFHIIVSNYDVFKDKINIIIKSFEQLLQKCVEEIEKLTKSNNNNKET